VNIQAMIGTVTIADISEKEYISKKFKRNNHFGARL